MQTLTVAIIATDGFSPFHFSVPCILFGPMMTDKKLFTVKICAETPGLIKADDGFAVEAPFGLEAVSQADIVIIPYWGQTEQRPAQPLLDALIQAYNRGAQLVGLCLGSFVLAYTGLLKGKRAATHWRFEQRFTQLFADVHLDSNALYVDDDRLITSAGTAAALDCCLYIIRQHFGSVVANKIARRMVVPPHREGGQAQFIEHSIPQNTRDETINELLDYLRQNIAQSHSLDLLAKRVSMSRRTLIRHFTKATGMSVSSWISTERLQRSQQLLEAGTLSVETIADKVGFQSAVTFRQRFKSQFGVSPAEWRKTFRGSERVD